MNVAAVDIGGANIKGAVLNGSAFTIPFALWRRPAELTEILTTVFRERFCGVEVLAVTMTGELCDCFEDKITGVRHILTSVRQATARELSQTEVLVWRTDSRLVSLAEAHRDPLPTAAANWLALAHHAARLRPTSQGILIDMGSTTTDIVPLRAGVPVPRGRTDTERLITGELVYTGCRRTPVNTVVRELPYRGQACPVCAEVFATLLDVGLTLGLLGEDPHDLDTADGREATRERARDRLARMIGADRTSFSSADATVAAEAILLAQKSMIRAACDRLTAEMRPLDFIVLSGSGEVFAAGASEGLGGEHIFLSRLLGPAASAAAPAVALASLAGERKQSPA